MRIPTTLGRVQRLITQYEAELPNLRRRMQLSAPASTKRKWQQAREEWLLVEALPTLRRLQEEMSSSRNPIAAGASA